MLTNYIYSNTLYHSPHGCGGRDQTTGGADYDELEGAETTRTDNCGGSTTLDANLIRHPVGGIVLAG